MHEVLNWGIYSFMRKEGRLSMHAYLCTSRYYPTRTKGIGTHGWPDTTYVHMWSCNLSKKLFQMEDLLFMFPQVLVKAYLPWRFRPSGSLCTYGLHARLGVWIVNRSHELIIFPASSVHIHLGTQANAPPYLVGDLKSDLRVYGECVDYVCKC